MLVAIPIAEGDNARPAPAVWPRCRFYAVPPRSLPPGPFSLFVGSDVVIGFLGRLSSAIAACELFLGLSPG